MFDGITTCIWPIIVGIGLNWAAGRCRGKNARQAFRMGAWGTWLLVLSIAPITIVPFFGLVNKLVLLVPSAICYLIAVNSILKEIRAQQRGDYTDAA